MSDSSFELDIALPLKGWRRCELSYENVSKFCRRRSIELRTQSKEGEPTFKNEPLIPQADMYDLCIIMLSIARTFCSDFLSINYVKKRVVFRFKFDSEGCVDLFLEEIRTWLDRAKHIKHSVEIGKAKPFVSPNTNKRYVGSYHKKGML